jgi:hypothetical protein
MRVRASPVFALSFKELRRPYGGTLPFEVSWSSSLFTMDRVATLYRHIQISLMRKNAGKGARLPADGA